jgi:hypothetical protein
VAAALVAAVAGCSGGGAAAAGDSAQDPVATVHRAADVLVQQGSSRVRTSMEMAAGGTRVTIHGTGVYDYRARLGRLTVTLPRDPAGAEEPGAGESGAKGSGTHESGGEKRRPLTELFTPAALYMKNRGAGVPADTWVRIATATLSDGNLVTGGATDPYTAAQILRGADAVTYVGEAQVDGALVRHYRGVADLARAARAAGMDRPALTAAARGFPQPDVPFDVYLDGEGRVRKLRHRFGWAGGAHHPVTVTSVTLLYDFGVPAPVRLPDERDIHTGRIAE